MPFVVIDRIVVDPLRGTERLSAVGAAHEHHVGSGVEAGRYHARQHVNIIIRTGAGTVRRQEKLPNQSRWIYRFAETKDAANVDRGALVETGCNAPVFRIGRANAPNLVRVYIYSANKEDAVRVHIGRSPLRGVGNVDRI